MNFCPTCGLKNAADYKFCQECGTKLLSDKIIDGKKPDNKPDFGINI